MFHLCIPTATTATTAIPVATCSLATAALVACIARTYRWAHHIGCSIKAIY